MKRLYIELEEVLIIKSMMFQVVFTVSFHVGNPCFFKRVSV